MKLWEVIKELTEDPTKKFEAKLVSKDWTVCMKVVPGFSKYFKFEVFYGKRLIDQSLNGGAFNGNVALELDWQPVRQPVTWQEAIQAWSVGKRVRVSTIQWNHTFSPIEKMEVSPMMIQDGKWYVED